MTDEPAQAPGPKTHDWLASLGIALLLLLPVGEKALHIDDPVVLEVSQRILDSPLDPFSGDLDWLGSNSPLWQVTTNPPLLSYYLAPFLSIFGYWEWGLHFSLFPFLVVYALSTLWLAGRFTSAKWLGAMLVLFSPAVWPSINLMRDVPAAALSLGGLALVVAGADRANPRTIIGGALLLGLATVTKYSTAVLLPVAVLYLGPKRMTGWMTLSLAPLAAWCIGTWIQYGAAHPWFLLTGGHSGIPLPWHDKLFGAVVILGSCLLIAPAVAWSMARTGALIPLVTAVAAGMMAWAAAWWSESLRFSTQQGPWLVSGLILLVAVLGFRKTRGSREDAFLLLWLLAVLLFSIFFSPFQAVRHLLLAFPPLVFLLLRKMLDTSPVPASKLLWGCLMVQVLLALAVAAADYELAGCNRRLAEQARNRLQSSLSVRSRSGAVWFVGHWGWYHYAKQQGWRQLHREGPYPEPGDYLVWPQRVHVGRALEAISGLRERLELVDTLKCEAAIPIRTMNFEGAAFYATIRGNLPFALQWDRPLDNLRVYQVKNSR